MPGALCALTSSSSTPALVLGGTAKESAIPVVESTFADNSDPLDSPWPHCLLELGRFHPPDLISAWQHMVGRLAPSRRRRQRIAALIHALRRSALRNGCIDFDRDSLDSSQLSGTRIRGRGWRGGGAWWKGGITSANIP